MNIEAPKRIQSMAHENIHLRYIAMFQAIVQTGTITDAATLLNISQPAATKLLQQTARHLGFPLFVRVKGRLRLTPESELIKGQIDQIFARLGDLQLLIASITRAEHRILRIISAPTLAFGIIPKAVTRLRRQLGKPTVELSTQHPPDMFKSVLLRETDIGIALQETTHPDLCCEPVCTGSLMVIAPPDTWRGNEADLPMHASALSGKDLVGISTTDVLGQKLQSYLQQIDPPPHVSIWVQTYQIARDLVSDGAGYALVDPFMAGSNGPPVQMRRAMPDLPLTLYAVYRNDTPLNSAQRSFLQCVKAVALEALGSAATTPTQSAATA